MRCPLLLRRPRTALRLVPAPGAWLMMKWAWGCRLPARRRRVLGRAGRLCGYRAMQSGARALRSRTKRSARSLGLGTGMDRTIAVATRLSGQRGLGSILPGVSSSPCMIVLCLLAVARLLRVRAGSPGLRDRRCTFHPRPRRNRRRDGGTITRVPAARGCLPKSLTTPDCPTVFVRLAAYGPRSQSLRPADRRVSRSNQHLSDSP